MVSSVAKGAGHQHGRELATAICPPARAVALAGIWDIENWVHTFAVIACPDNDLMAQIRDRMPVIVRPTAMTAGSRTSSRTPTICSSLPDASASLSWLPLLSSSQLLHLLDGKLDEHELEPIWRSLFVEASPSVSR
jgi:hypothetical protein